MSARTLPLAAQTAADSLAGPQASFHKARQLLRQTEPLSHSQFAEIDELFRVVSHAQFIDLTDDPAHQHQLRSYRTLSRRLGLRGIAFAAAGFAIAGGLAALLLVR